MQSVLIFDPRRVPRDWVDLLHEGQCAVFLSDIHSGAVLDGEGTPADRGKENCLVFDSLADAKQFCEEVVERCEHVRCDIYDERGLAVSPLVTIVGKRHQRQLRSKKSVHRLIVAGVLSMVLSIPLFRYDWLSSGERIWPTFVGINLILLGLRLLYLAYSESMGLRRAKAERAAAEAKIESAEKARP